MGRIDPCRRHRVRHRPAWRAAWCASLALAVSAAASGREAPDLRPPPLACTVRTLPNGLRLILHEDHSAPIVNVQVWYHVGSKDEQPGHNGFARLLEHLMFDGARSSEPGRPASRIAAVGGRADAYTTEDVTVFWETVPSPFLPLALRLEADRMASLRLDKDALDRARDVVKEARAARVENQPYGRLSEIVREHAFAVHPYRRPTTGTMADLDAATLDEVRRFHRSYYVPANATVVIAGDVESADAVNLAAKYFGAIQPPGRLVRPAIPAEPSRTSASRVTVEESWPLPVVVVAHLVTADGHPDSYPLHMAAKILSDGQHARIYRALIYETGIAASAAGIGHLGEHPGLFYAFAVVQPGHTPAEAEQALVKELERLRSEPVSERELLRAKRQFARDYVLGRETVQQKASILGRASVLRAGDPGAADQDFDRFQRVTASDIRRVAQAYFSPDTRVVITVRPKLAGAATQ